MGWPGAASTACRSWRTGRLAGLVMRRSVAAAIRMRIDQAGISPW